MAATTSSTLAVSTTVTTTVTTVAPRQAAEQQIRDAYTLASRTFSACLVAMPTCDTSTLAVARAGALLERNVARINEWQTAGYTVRDRDKFRSVIESVVVADDLRTATMVTCIADGSRLVRPGAGPGGSDIVIDDKFTSGRDRWDFALGADGTWRATDGGPEGPTQGVDVCPGP